MKVKIRLLKDWNNGETDFPKGQLILVNEEAAEKLIEQEICEMYEPKQNDIISASTVSSGMTGEELAKTVKEIMAEINKTSGNAAAETELTKTGGFVNFADFAKHIHSAGPGGKQLSEKLSTYLKAPTGMSEGISADGGFLVPTEFRNTLMKDTLEASIVEPRATVIPMSSNTVKIPIVNETTRSGSVYGGIIIYRPDEGGQKTASKPKLAQITLTLHKLVGLVYVTDELLEDSPISLQPLLSTMFSEAIAFQKDDDFINGTGANQALGVLAAPALVVQAKEGGQAANTLVTNNIVKMWSRLKPRSHANSVWLANNDTFPQLATMTLDVGTGGAPVGLVQSVPGSPAVTLLGRPLILTEHCQTVGDKGDILLADFRQYLVGQKASGLQTATSIHLRFDYDETAFRFVLRYDGQPWETAPRTPKHSTITLGSFVTLAERT